MIPREELEKYLPKYLSPAAQSALMDELKQYPSNINSRMYSGGYQEVGVVYQGDCIDGMPFCHFPDVTVKKIPVMVFSNTCDISQDNPRWVPNRMVYSPIMNLGKYRDALYRAYVKTGEKSEGSIENHIEQIRQQKISHIFYLPEGQGVTEESFVRFDQVLSLPSDKVRVPDDHKRVFSLGNYGFYLFLFKLSIHFTRLMDGVDREAAA